eukprot:scaffold657_cov245-Pinguiococcus_pyrenoidosus.AAC.3
MHIVSVDGHQDGLRYHACDHPEGKVKALATEPSSADAVSSTKAYPSGQRAHPGRGSSQPSPEQD